MTSQLGLEFDVPRRRRAAALRSHHVRSHQTVSEAQAGERKAQRQEQIILAWFGRMSDFGDGERLRVTPSFVAAAMVLMDHNWPLTSIRRALTNLTRAGKLQHWPADRRPGPRGARESVWSLA